MAVLSLDIGTTKICALVFDEYTGTVIETREAGNVFLAPPHPWNRQQDPEEIFRILDGIISDLKKKYKTFRAIGISCQMHGILYLNGAGRAVSPLYTWQDQSAALPYSGGESYASYLAAFSPGRVAPGFGLATCFYHLKTNGIPSGAKKLCTIGDYIAMRLCRSSLPLTHITNAAGLGFFDLRGACFDMGSLERAGFDLSLLPDLSAGARVFGETPDGIPVCVAVGDNQASFLGAVRDLKESVAVNIGTGSQISLVSSDPARAGVFKGRALEVPALEVRPYFDDLFLVVGASLCGGRAYAILETFFRDVLSMAGFVSGAASLSDGSLYPAMNELALAGADSGGQILVDTLFAGSREDPSRRGSIGNISEDNFTPANLVAGFLNGIAAELYALYEPVREKAHKKITGSGNAIRKNEALRRILSEKFNMPLELAPHEEEAACGAALFALACTGAFKNVSEARYQAR